jgi:hypothetical protein
VRLRVSGGDVLGGVFLIVIGRSADVEEAIRGGIRNIVSMT